MADFNPAGQQITDYASIRYRAWAVGQLHYAGCAVKGGIVPWSAVRCLLFPITPPYRTLEIGL